MWKLTSLIVFVVVAMTNSALGQRNTLRIHHVDLESEHVRLEVRTEDGKHSISLWRDGLNTPYTRIKTGSQYQVIGSPVLYRGKLHTRSRNANRSDVVSADYFRGRLNVFFSSHRGRFLRASVMLPKKGQTSKTASLMQAGPNLPVSTSRAKNLRTGFCASEGSARPGNLPPLTAEYNRRTTLSTLTHRGIRIAIAADYDFYRSFNQNIGDASAYIASVMNYVNAVYEEQLRITFVIRELEIITSSSKEIVTSHESPSGNTEERAATQAQLRTHFEPLLFSNAIDIGHLFTGKNLWGITVGAAVEKVCSGIAVGFSERIGDLPIPPVEQWILTAHEMGHHLGANHDDSEPPTIMTSSVDPSSETRLSAFSTNEIEGFISTRGFLAGISSLCLAPIEKAKPTPLPTAPVFASPTPDSSSGTITPPPSRTPSDRAKLAISISRKGRLSITVIGNSFLNSECEFDVLASTNRNDMIEPFSGARSIISLKPIGSERRMVLTVPQIKRAAIQPTYFLAKQVCRDSTTVSNFRSLPKGAGKGKRVKGKAFLQYLQNLLQTRI